MSQVERGFIRQSVAEGGPEIFRVQPALVDAGQLDRAPRESESGGFVPQKHQGHIGCVSDPRIVVIPENGVDRSAIDSQNVRVIAAVSLQSRPSAPKLPVARSRS